MRYLDSNLSFHTIVNKKKGLSSKILKNQRIIKNWSSNEKLSQKFYFF